MTKQQKEKLAEATARKFDFYPSAKLSEAMQAYHKAAKEIEFKENCKALREL